MSIIEVQDQFMLPARPDRVWEFIQDTPSVFGCLANAELGAATEDGRRPATMRMRVANVNLAFRGSVHVQYDRATRGAVLDARGSDLTGAVKARAEVFIAIGDAPGERTTLDVRSRIEMFGALAEIMKVPGQKVSAQILRDFGDCLSGRLAS